MQERGIDIRRLSPEAIDNIMSRYEERIEQQAARMVERLRSLNESLMENGNDLRTRCQKAEARIKELEADRIAYRNLGSRIEDLETYIERLEAAFLKAEERVLWDEVVVDGPKEGRAVRHIAIVQQKAREELERIKSNEKL